LIEVEYDEADVLGSDDDKVRVSSLRVIKELHPFKDLGLPNSDKLETLIGRIQKIKWKCQTVQRKKKISALVRRYAKELSTNDKKFIVKTIKYYSVKEWASLRASLRDSLRASLGASLRDSLRDSLWDSLRASLRDSLWDSLWASLGASLWDSLWDSLGASLGASFRASQDDKYKAFGTEMDIVLSSAVLMGITDDGTAHVVMPGKDEMNEKNL
jgi:hypothetical protein